MENMEKNFSIVLDKTVSLLVPFIDKFARVIYFLCDVALLLLMAVCFLPFEELGWEREGEWLTDSFVSLGYFILVAYGMKEVFVFLNHLKDGDSTTKVWAIIRFVSMIVLCVILGYFTYSLV